MSSPFDEREEYLRNPFLKREFGDFTTFYVIIAICTIFGFFLLILNVTLCCSRYKDYWCDSNTGNRWILPIWTKTPHCQPPLDLTELSDEFVPPPVTEPYYIYPDNYSDYEVSNQHSTEENYLELAIQKKSKESMAFHVYWPALSVLTLFIVCVIIALLRWGPRFCKTRNDTLPSHSDWEEKSYEQKISFA